MQPDSIIIYSSLFQEYMLEYCNIVDTKRLEPTDSKKFSKDEPLILMSFTVAIEAPVNKTVEKVYCKSCHKGEIQ